MGANEANVPRDAAGAKEGGEIVEAPSQRARALREEIFGSALTLDEVAYILSLDRTTVAKYLRENTIVGFQIGREWLVPEEELRAYLRRMTEQRREAALQKTLGPEWTTGPQKGPPERARWDPLGLWGWGFPVGVRKGRKGSPSPKGGHWDRFTARARRVLSLAQEEAWRLNHNYMGTEHLLLGLVREGEGVAAKVLSYLGVELEQARGAVEAIIGRGDHPVTGEVGVTPRVKKVIELAVDEARRMSQHYIGTEHLLLGLVREGDGIGVGVLENLGVTPDRARAETLRVLGQMAPGTLDPADEPAPPVSAEADALLRPDEQGLPCDRCTARNPAYFRYCFNCGERLASG
jgi:excisionase family DNA binding protein